LPHGLHGPVAGFVDGRFVATTGYYQVGGFNGFQSITYVSNVLSTTTAPNTPYLGKPFTKGQLIGAAQYDYGGEGVAYHDSTTANLGGDNLRPGTAVDIQAGGTTGHVIGHSAPGEWLDFTITVPAAGTYSLQANLANPGSGATFHAEFGGNLSGQNLTGPITIPNTGSWTTYKLVTSTSFTLPAGTTTMRIVLDKNSSANAVGNFDWFRIV